MRIKPEQLQQHLAKTLMPVYLVSGEEPLLIQEACDSIRSAARKMGVSDRQCFTDDKNFDWNYLLEEANSLSLFADKKLLEVRLDSGKFSEAASKALESYCKNPAEDNVLLIITGKIDAATSKKKWFAQLEDIGAFIQIWPVKPEQFPGWLRQRLNQAGFQADNSAIELLQERVEGNLLAAQQEIEKLRLLTSEQSIDANTIIDAVGHSARYNIFDLSDACIKGNPQQVIRILQGLQAEGQTPIALLGFLMRTIRILQELNQALKKQQPTQSIMARNKVFGPSQNAYISAAKRLTPRQFQQLFDIASQLDLCAKGMLPEKSEWALLSQLTLLTSGKTLQL